MNDQNYNRKYDNDPSPCSIQQVSLNYSENVDELARVNLNFSDGHSENACDYLTSGFPFHTYAGRKGGPRPVIRPGGWIELGQVGVAGMVGTDLPEAAGPRVAGSGQSTGRRADSHSLGTLNRNSSLSSPEDFRKQELMIYKGDETNSTQINSSIGD